MKKILVALFLAAVASTSHAGFISYDISSTDDLDSIQIGDTISITATLPGITGTWNETAIFNAFVQSSDQSLWSTPTNISLNSDIDPVFGVNAIPGRVNWVHVDTPLTMTSDFVISFDVTAVANGSGLWIANGADIFQATAGSETFYTSSDSIAFTIGAPVPEPAALLMLAMGLIGIGAGHRKRIIAR